MENESSIVKAGEKVVIKADSKFYQGIYTCDVLEVDKDHLVISIPYDQGKIVSLAAGTKLKVSKGSKSLDSEVLSRKFGESRHLIIAKPGSIFRGSKMEEISNAKVIAVTSGKGGVGKSSLSINIAISLARLGKRVCIVDADLGMANVDVLLNLNPEYNLTHLIKGTVDIFDIVTEGPEEILVIPWGLAGRK